MHLGTGFSTLFAALTNGRSATMPAADGRSGAPHRAFEQEPLPDLSMAGFFFVLAAVFMIEMLSIDFSHRSKFVATFWCANAVLLVPILRHRRSLRNYGLILGGGAIAIAAASVIGGNSPSASAVLAVANVIEISLCVGLLRVFRIDAANLTQFRNLLIFIVMAGGVAPIASATIGGWEMGSGRDIPFIAIWRNWYLAHGLGMVIVVPFLLSLTSNEWQALRSRERVAEAAAIFGLVVALGVCAAYFRFVMFLIVPAILFATIRFGLIGATIATVVTALIASAFVVMGVGEPLLTRPELSDRILALQVLLAFTSLWSLPTAALLVERDGLLTELSQTNSHLQAESETKSNLVVGLRRHLSIAEENERLRLSHELHDQAGQGLIAAILELNEIEPLIVGSGSVRLHQIRKKMEELGKTLHRIAWELRPSSIDELGLKKALASYVAEWGEQCGTDVDFHCDDPNLDDVPSEIGTTVYRTVQEGLTNIFKHAHDPSNVSVVIRRVNATLQVIVEDNGCGFDAAALTAKAGGHSGLGLDGMRERLFLVGGTLEIESGLDAGTTIFARIALDAQRSAA
jgi:signal transduction histidine kinase